MIASSIEMTAKKSHYGVDGTGRDSYINFNNGGNYRGYRLEGLGKFQIGTMRQPHLNKRKSYTNVQGKPVHYVGDGTGRDVYVIHNEGGIAEKGIGKKFNFLESLRAPISRREVKKDDVFMKTNDSWRSKDSQWERNSASHSFYQASQTRRLSEPKRTEDPYNKMRNSFRSSLGFGK